MIEHERAQHYAILVRHARREARWDRPEEQHPMAGWEDQPPDPKSDFDEKDENNELKSYTLTYAMAGRLCEQLLTDNIAVKKIIHSEHLVARQTAEVYKRVIERREINRSVIGAEGASGVEIHEWDALNPGCYSDKAAEEIKNHLESQPLGRHHGRPASLAYILVSHQPELTTIACRWLGKALPFRVLPIEGSEAACLALGEEPRLLWLITNKSQVLMADLKDKIKSKYDVAKFFLGAFVVNTGLILNAGVWDNIGANLAWIDQALIILAIIAALASLTFTAATLFSYDGLLMPATFWSEEAQPTSESPRGIRKPPRWSVSRPPSQAHVVLFYEMVHVWTAFFMPAIVAAFTAVGLLVIALARPGAGVLVEDPLALAFSLVVYAFLLPWVFYQSRKPRLGSED